MLDSLRSKWNILLIFLGILGAVVFISRMTPGRQASPKAVGWLERIVEHPEKIEFSVSADSDTRARGAGSYHWTAEQLRQGWTRLSNSGTVTWRSPKLDFGSLDEIHSLAIRLAPDAKVRSFNLHWSESPALTPLVLGRNHRALTYWDAAAAGGALLVLGEDISATQELDPLASPSPPRYFFLRYESEDADHLPFDSVRILSQSSLFALQPHGLTRDDRNGHIRDALYTPVPGEITYRTDVAGPSDLSFGVRNLSGASAVRYTVRAAADGASTTVFDQTIQEAGGWRDFRIPIPFAAEETMITFRAESAVPGNTAFWANPRIIPESGEKKTNVVLFVADALRADRLGLYGYPNAASPFLDRLGAKGMVFLNCYSTASWTKPSVASLLTSLYPQTHGIGLRSNTDVLPETALTLQDHLRSRGYVTAHLSANPLGSTLSNLDQGFDSVFTTGFFEPPGRRPPKVRSVAIIDTALEWIEDHRDESFFLYIHAMDTHAPYSRDPSPAGLPAEGAHDPGTALYDAEVSYTDRQIQRLYEHLEGRGLADRTLFVVTSDHGEAFGEHGRTGHGTSVYQEEIQVPLLMIHQGVLKPQRVEEPVSLIDVMPTVLRHGSIRFKAGELQGVNILSPRERRQGRAIVASRCVFPESGSSSEGDVFAVIRRNQKLIASVPQGGREPAFELYNLADDPSESRNLAETQPDLARALYSELLEFLDLQKQLRREFVTAQESGQNRPRTRWQGTDTSIPHDVIERLRTLGYIR